MTRPLGRKLMRIGIVTAAAAAAVLLLAFSDFLFPEEEVPPAPPLRESEAMAFATHELRRGDIEDSVRVDAYAVAVRKVDVSFPTSGGYLDDVLVAVGDDVYAGQLLAYLDNDDLRSDVERQRILLEGARDALEQYRDISTVEIELGRMELQRMKDEFAAYGDIQETIAKLEYERYRNDIAVEELHIRQQELEQIRNQAEMERAIRIDELTLADLERDLAKTELRAPIPGIVDYATDKRPGEELKGRPTLFTIAAPEDLFLEYRGSLHNQFQRNVPVTATIDGEDYEGTVAMTSRQVPHEERNAFGDAVRFRLADPPDGLGPGDDAEVVMVKARAEDVLVLPKRFVHNYVGRKYVRVLEDGLVREKDVELGIESATHFEIRAGLEDGESVVE